MVPVKMTLIRVGSTRTVMKQYTFSDGTAVPAGVVLAAPLRPLLIDENIYEDPNEFRGFRFNDLRERNGESAKYQASNTTPEFLHFGHGRHAW